MPTHLGARPTHYRARPRQSEFVFTLKRALLQIEMALSTPYPPPSDNPAGEEAGCGGPGLAWLNVVCGCEAGWTYCQILQNDIGGGREINIKLSGNSSGVHSCSQHANCTLSK
jgi:hypothetical protein